MNYQNKKSAGHLHEDTVSSPRPRYLIQSQKDYEARNQARKIFFNELVDDRGYQSDQITFNAPVPGLGPDTATDLLVYEDEAKQRVFCITDFIPMSEFGLPVEKIAEIVEKARRFGARFAIAITPAMRWHVDVELWSKEAPDQGMIASFPNR